MGLDTTRVGSQDRLVYLAGDPSAAANLQSVLSVADARSLAGLFAAVGQNANLLLNAAGTYDIARSALGTTGIPAVNTEGSKATYSVAIVGFTPVATATDFCALVGSATRTGRLLRMTISGFATAAISVDVQLIKRITANSGGTPTAATIGAHDSNDAAASCVFNTYAANPTLGNSGGVFRAEKLNLGATGAAGRIEWDFTTRNGRGLVLRGIAQHYALNWNGAAIPGGTTLNFDLEFTEEA